MLRGIVVIRQHAVGTVIHCHGHGSNHSQAVQFAQIAEGINIISINWPSHGTSDDAPCTMSIVERNDLHSVCEWAERNGLGPISLYGRSMGAATAVSSIPLLPHVRAMVSDSSFSCLAKVVSGKCGQWVANSIDKQFRLITGFSLEDAGPLKVLASCDRSSLPPALFISPFRDDVIPPAHSAELQKEYGHNSCYQQFHGEHASERPKDTMVAVYRFLSSAFFPYKPCHCVRGPVVRLVAVNGTPAAVVAFQTRNQKDGCDKRSWVHWDISRKAFATFETALIMPTRGLRQRTGNRFTRRSASKSPKKSISKKR